MVSLLTSASFSYTLSTNQCFTPLTTNLTPLLVRKELPDGLALETMLVMPSPTNSLMMTPRKSSTDLLSDPQILPIPIGIWYQMEGRAPRPPNPLSLSDLVSLAKTEELPDGCARDVWERLTSEYDLTEGEDKITLLSMFQQNQLEDVRTNISVGLTSMAIQLMAPKPIVFVRSRQDNSQSATKPMAEYNPDDLIGRTFLLPKNEQGERLRATIKRKVIETSKLLDDQHENAIDKIYFHLDVGQGSAEAIMSYVQILDHLDQQEQQEDLYKSRAITGHQGPLSPQDENYKGSKYNVMVEWETGEITDEPLSLIAVDDPVTCAEYAKKHVLLHLDGWKRLNHIAKNQKQLTRAINQSKIRQVRRSAVYQFGFLIPRITNKHYNWMNKMATVSGVMPLSLRWTKSMSTKSFRTTGKPNMIPSRGRYPMPQMDTRKSGSTSSLLSNMMADTKLDWLLADISLQILLQASTLVLCPPDPLDWSYS